MLQDFGVDVEPALLGIQHLYCPLEVALDLVVANSIFLPIYNAEDKLASEGSGPVILDRIRKTDKDS